MDNVSAENAPVVHLLLTVSFSPPLDLLTIIDIAEVYGLFREEFPVFQQISRAGAMTLQSPPPLTFESTGLPPRVSFSTADLSYAVLFQGDRLSMGWTRTSPLGSAAGYPGFEVLFARFVAKMGILRSWLSERGSHAVPQVGELVYTDAFAQEAPTRSSALRPSDLFGVINPDISFPIDRIECSWVEPLPSDQVGFARASVNGPGLSPSGSKIFTLETTVTFDLSAVGWGGLGRAFEMAHGVGTDIFKRVVKPNALATL